MAGKLLTVEEVAGTISPKDTLVVMRQFPSEPERALGRERMERSWGHIRPNSVMIAAMGNHWSEGCWHRFCDMVQKTTDSGVCVALDELQDRCQDPYDALGTMRNEAILHATNEGYEWLCYVDTDIMPEPDTLLKLLKWDMPIVAPYIVEPGSGKLLAGPFYEPNHGLVPIRWCVLSLLLFRCSVFNCVGPRFWGDAIGADEGYHFKTLWHYGHRPWLDTNTQLVVAGKPTYPLATNRMTRTQAQRDEARVKAEQVLTGKFGPEAKGFIELCEQAWGHDGREQFWEHKQMSRLNPPDRRAPIGADPKKVVDGDYMPWGMPPAPAPQPVVTSRGALPSTIGLGWAGTKPIAGVN